MRSGHPSVSIARGSDTRRRIVLAKEEANSLLRRGKEEEKDGMIRGVSRGKDGKAKDGIEKE